MEKETLLILLGPFPAKTDLNPSVLESVDCGAYVREKVEYSAEDNDRVKAYILIPKNIKPNTPAIFCHHQHADNFELGKSEVVGLSDVSVGLDYLEGRPEIDKKKIGFIGHSYGGRMAIWAPAFDRRIKVSVSNCGCVNYKNSLGRETGIQMEFCVPGIMQHGDIEDIIKMIEPSSILISATDDDELSRGAQEIYDYAKPAFVSGKLRLKIWPGKHIFSKDMREEAYSFLDKYLKRPQLL